MQSGSHDEAIAPWISPPTSKPLDAAVSRSKNSFSSGGSKLYGRLKPLPNCCAKSLGREKFGVSRVVVFGSGLDEQAFHTESDIDLAVWDLPSECYLPAVAKLLALSDFAFDLVLVESVSPYLRAAIAQGRPR